MRANPEALLQYLRGTKEERWSSGGDGAAGREEMDVHVMQRLAERYESGQGAIENDLRKLEEKYAAMPPGDEQFVSMDGLCAELARMGEEKLPDTA